MPTYRTTSHAGWIAFTLLLASVDAVASQTYPQRDQQQQIDQLRLQRQQTEQRLRDDMRMQQQLQDSRRQQLELEDRIRRQQLQNQIDRQQR